MKVQTISVETIAETIAEQVCDYRMDQAEHKATMDKYRPAINKTQPEHYKRYYENATRWYEKLQDRINAAVVVADALGIWEAFDQHLKQLEEVHN